MDFPNCLSRLACFGLHQARERNGRNIKNLTQLCLPAYWNGTHRSSRWTRWEDVY